MQRTAVQQTPLSKLNNTMAKLGIKPTVSLIYHEVTEGRSIFMMRVTCPISQDGPPLSADGSYAWSKKEAKHSAALAFMDKYLNNKNNEQSKTTHSNTQSTINHLTVRSEEHNMQKIDCSKNNLGCPEVEDVGFADLSCAPMQNTHTYPTTAVTAVTEQSKEHDMLESICLKNNLERPEVEDLGIIARLSCAAFIAQCKVSDLCIRGRGNSESEARLHAIVRMIQLLTGTASIHEILKSPQLTESEMQLLAMEAYENGMISSSDSREGSQLQPVQNYMNDGQNVDVELPEEPTLLTIPGSVKTRLAFMNARKKAEKTEDDNINSVSNVKQRHLANGFEQKAFVTKSSGRLLSNNISQSVSNGVESKNSDKITKNSTCLWALSRIDRTLGKVEKQLHEEMLNVLEYCDLPHRQTVAMFSHDYDVFIHESSPKIFEGRTECTDQSIRVACLTKLLMGLKEHIEINRSTVIK